MRRGLLPLTGRRGGPTLPVMRNYTLAPWILGLGILGAWQAVCAAGLIPAFMLPSPVRVAAALADDLPLLAAHTAYTLSEAVCGLGLALLAAFALALAMDASGLLKAALGPLLLLTQTVPAVALAPLLILWLGYGAAPKIALVFLTCFFPLTLNLASAFAAADADEINLLASMGASRAQLYRYIKLPSSLGPFFAGLRTAASYAIIGAVIAEWLGGEAGLGVYMIRVRKSYSFDRMFAAIFVVVILTLALLKAVGLAENLMTPWRRQRPFPRRRARATLQL